MGTKRGQVRKTARRAYSRGPRPADTKAKRGTSGGVRFYTNEGPNLAGAALSSLFVARGGLGQPKRLLSLDLIRGGLGFNVVKARRKK